MTDALEAARELAVFLGPVPEKSFSYVEKRALAVARAYIALREPRKRAEFAPNQIAGLCDVALQDALIEVDDAGERVMSYDDVLFVQSLAGNGYRIVPVEPSASASADVERLIAALRKLAIHRRVRLAYGGGHVPSGGSCALCQAEWSTLDAAGEPIDGKEHHKLGCALSSPPSPEGNAAGDT